MQRLLAVSLALVPGMVCAQAVVKVWERTLPIDPSLSQVEFLTNGSFAVLLGSPNTSRIYISTRKNAVTSVTPLNALVTKITTDSTGVYAIGSINNNSFFAKIGFNGAVLWTRVMDVSSLSLNDIPSDLVVAPNGNLLISGLVVTSPTPYGYCVGLDKATGAIAFRATNAGMDSVQGLGVTANNQIHLTGATKYWRLNATGATQQISPHGGGISMRDIEARDDKVYIVGSRDTGSRLVPTIIRRSNVGGFLGNQDDPFAIGTAFPIDTYRRVLIDGSGNAIANGMISNNQRYSRIAKWSPALTANPASWFADNSQRVYDGPIALDRYNCVYWVNSWDKNTQPSGQLQLNKLSPSFTTQFQHSDRFTTDEFTAKPESVAVDNTSGDMVLLISETGTGLASWMLLRQQAIPLADTYNVSSSPYNSPLSLMANDRFSSDSVLEIVTLPSKGVLNMDTGGYFAYTMNMGASGTDSFVYRLRKNGLVGVAAKVTLNLP